MRLLLDAKDLIELVERSQPMPVESFATWLSERGAKIVLTLTNVSEFADCFAGVSDLLYIRSMIQALERLRVAYLQEALIDVNETELAIAAFDRGEEPAVPNPYVSRWDHTFTKRSEAPPAEMIVGLRLDEIVFQLLKQPDAHRRRLPRIALKGITDERAIPRAERLRPRAALTRAVENKIRFWQLTHQPGDWNRSVSGSTQTRFVVRASVSLGNCFARCRPTTRMRCKIVICGTTRISQRFHTSTT